MGGKGGAGLIFFGMFLGVALLLLFLLVLWMGKQVLGSVLAHVVPVATVQFIDFSSDILVLIDFWRAGMTSRLLAGAFFMLLSFAVSAVYVFRQRNNRQLFRSRAEAAMCALYPAFYPAGRAVARSRRDSPRDSP